MSFTRLSESKGNQHLPKQNNRDIFNCLNKTDIDNLDRIKGCSCEQYDFVKYYL